MALQKETGDIAGVPGRVSSPDVVWLEATAATKNPVGKNCMWTVCGQWTVTAGSGVWTVDGGH